MQKKLYSKNLKHSLLTSLNLIEDKNIPQVKIDDEIVVKLLNYSNSIQTMNFKSIERKVLYLN